MEAQVIFHDTGDKKVAVVIAFLPTQGKVKALLLGDR